MPKKHQQNDKNTVYYYTDGSSIVGFDNRRISTFAYAIIKDNTIISRYSSNIERKATAQRMELKAVLFAAENASTREEYGKSKIVICSDSAYVINSILNEKYNEWRKNNLWRNSRGKKIKNKDLWLKLIPYIETGNITFQKVKAHSDDLLNEYVNNIAQSIAIQKKYSYYKN